MGGTRDQPFGLCEGNQRVAVPNTELLEDVVEMGLDRSLAYEEFLPDLLVAKST